MNTKKYGSPILIILLALSLISPILIMLLQEANATSSPGDYLFGVGSPLWYGGYQTYLSSRIGLVAAAEGNIWRQDVYNNTATSGYMTALKSLLDADDIKLILQPLASSVGAMTPAYELEIINDVGSAQDDWIATFSNMISVLQPYGITVMNEPTNGGTFNIPSAGEFALYRQFCINCITAWRAVKPDLVVFIQNDPFTYAFNYTTYGFASTPLSQTSIIYTYHYYYSWDGTYPPAYQPELQAYWNAVTDGDLVAAKADLGNFIDSYADCMTTQGKPVAWEEWGANVANPNALNFTRDFISLCNIRNIGNIYYSLTYSGDSPTGLLNVDLQSLNSQGLVWASMGPTPTPTPTASPTPSPYAGPIVTYGSFALSFTTGGSFMVQDTAEPENITFTVIGSVLEATASLNTTLTGGTLAFTPSTSGSIFCAAIYETTKVTINGVLFGGAAQAFTAGVAYSIVWLYDFFPASPSPTPSPGGSVLPSLNMDWLWIYLYSGDVLGFLQALLLGSFGFLDLVYGLIAMLFLVPLYLRTKSLLLIAILWILIGSFFIVMMPVVSGLAVLFIALGIGGLLYRIFRGGNQ